MTIPLVILSVLSVFGGFLNIPTLFGGNSSFSTFLQSAVQSKVTEEMSPATEIGLIVVSLTLLSLIILIAYRIFIKKSVVPVADGVTMSFFDRIITNKFYIDEIYAFVFEKPLGVLSDFFFNKIENTVLDPAIDGIGLFTVRLGTVLRKLQKGNMSFYLFAMVAGILLFIIFILTV